MRILLSIIIFAACAFALIVGIPAARAQGPGAGRTAEQMAIRKALIQKIEQVKYRKMRHVLQLDNATAQRFFAVYKPAEHEVQALVQERNEVLRTLATATNSNTSDADLSAMAQKVRGLNQQISDREQKLATDLKPILSPLQRAKLIIFEHKFNQRIREQLAKRRLLKDYPELRKLRRQLREQRKRKLLLKQSTKGQ